MTDTATVPQGNITALTIDDLDQPTMLTLHDAYWAYMEHRQADNDTRDRNWQKISTSPQPGVAFSYHLQSFLNWLNEHPEHRPQPAPTVEVAPIGPETPGWLDWWQELADHAEEDGYQEQYNILARAFHVAEIAAEEECEHYADVSVNMTVRVYFTAMPSDVENNGPSEYIEESDVDDAIRDYIRNNSADWNIEEWDQN